MRWRPRPKRRRIGESSPRVSMKIGVLLSRVRLEEKQIFEALDKRGLTVDRLDDRLVIFDFHGPRPEYDAVLIRSISQSRAIYAAGILNGWGIPTVNSHTVISNCADKVSMTRLLVESGVPCPKTMVCLSPESALRAMESMGYPVVMKPVVGSWGRLLARVNDRCAAEALVEHKDMLGSPQHSVYYVQEHIEKPGRDIRVVVIRGEPVAAMFRYSDHWVTNSARGARSENCPITPGLGDLAVAAAAAVGGGAVGVDVFESERGLLVNEVNGTMEFKACAQASGVDVAGLLVDHLMEVARG